MGFYKDGQIITKKKQIVKNYYKGEFWYDFLPTLSLILTEEDDSFIYVVYLEILRILQLKKLVGKVEFHFNLYEKYTTTTMLIKLLFMNLSIAHYTGCGFIYIGRIQENEQNSWINQFSSENYFSQYLDGLYYSVITMSTVGYGDISPVTQPEKLYVIIITIISCGVFAYAVQTIGTIFQNSEYKHETRFGPGESILNMEDKDRKICFLLEEELMVQFKRKNEIQYKTNNIPYFEFQGPPVQVGSVLGINSLLSHNKINFNVVSKSVSKIVHFSKQQFIECIQEFQNDLEVFNMLKDQFQQKIINFDTCFMCEKNKNIKFRNHDTSQCYLAQYNPDKLLLISKYNYSYPQQRHKLKKVRYLEKSKTLQINNIIKQRLKQFRIQQIIDPSSPLLQDNFNQTNGTENFQQFQQLIIEKAQSLNDSEFFKQFPIYQKHSDGNLSMSDFYTNQLNFDNSSDDIQLFSGGNQQIMSQNNLFNDYLKSYQNTSIISNQNSIDTPFYSKINSLSNISNQDIINRSRQSTLLSKNHLFSDNEEQRIANQKEMIQNNYYKILNNNSNNNIQSKVIIEENNEKLKQSTSPIEQNSSITNNIQYQTKKNSPILIKKTSSDNSNSNTQDSIKQQIQNKTRNLSNQYKRYSLNNNQVPIQNHNLQQIQQKIQQVSQKNNSISSLEHIDEEDPQKENQILEPSTYSQNSRFQGNKSSIINNLQYLQQNSNLKLADVISYVPPQFEQQQQQQIIKAFNGQKYLQYPEKEYILNDSTQQLYKFYNKQYNYTQVIDQFQYQQQKQLIPQFNVSGINNSNSFEAEKNKQNHKKQRISVNQHLNFQNQFNLIHSTKNNLFAKIISGRIENSQKYINKLSICSKQTGQNHINIKDFQITSPVKKYSIQLHI